MTFVALLVTIGDIAGGSIADTGVIVSVAADTESTNKTHGIEILPIAGFLQIELPYWTGKQWQ
jgi:hypothetical protein